MIEGMPPSTMPMSIYMKGMFQFFSSHSSAKAQPNTPMATP